MKIAVILEGSKNPANTVLSLESNKSGEHEIVIYRDGEFKRPSILWNRQYRADLYWRIPSGCLVLTSKWDKYFDYFRPKSGMGSYGIYCGGKHPATSRSDGKHKKKVYATVLQVIE